MADHWILGDLVFVVEGVGYGLDDYLRTFRIGTESEILLALEDKESTDGKYGEIRRNLIRAGVDGLLWSDETAVGGMEGKRIAVSKAVSPATPVSRKERRRVVKPLRGKVRRG